jgi:ligand-binding SRPBCC domain-containing protein
MRMIRFEKVQRLGVGTEAAWEFFSNTANLPLITPPDLGFALTSPLPERMHPGMIITYTVKPFGMIRVRWVSEITNVVHPLLFVDEQRFGPYRFWHHQHHFRKLENGVEMQDIIHYSIPYDPFSRLISGLVARRLEYIFDYRRMKLEELFRMKGT